MKAFRVRLFELPRPDGVQAAVAKEIPGFAVDADHLDGARKAARTRLAGWGRVVRSLTPAVGPEAALVAVVYEKVKTAAP